MVRAFDDDRQALVVLLRISADSLVLTGQSFTTRSCSPSASAMSWRACHPQMNARGDSGEVTATPTVR